MAPKDIGHLSYFRFPFLLVSLFGMIILKTEFQELQKWTWIFTLRKCNFQVENARDRTEGTWNVETCLWMNSKPVNAGASFRVTLRNLLLNGYENLWIRGFGFVFSWIEFMLFFVFVNFVISLLSLFSSPICIQMKVVLHRHSLGSLSHVTDSQWNFLFKTAFSPIPIDRFPSNEPNDWTFLTRYYYYYHWISQFDYRRNYRKMKTLF